MIKNNYENYVKEVTPTNSLFKNMLLAFLFGGAICALGQLLLNLFIASGLSYDNSINYEILILVGLSSFLTGLGIYSKIATLAGAGTLVPITGFSNSIASCAIEFKKEGQVFGIGCKVFTIAGPVILYGLLSSSFLGFIYWLWSLISK